MSGANFDRVRWLGQFSTWCDPTTFQQLVSECRAELPPFGAMINHGLVFWRDAWIASQVSSELRADEVRLLHPSPFPDFALRRLGVETWFEATEAMPKGRRRGDEFKENLAAFERGESAIRQHPEYDWLTEQKAFEMLKSAADQKANKSYASQCGLVIYLNDSEYKTRQLKVVETFRPATELAGKKYQSVHVLWNSQLHDVWNGNKLP